MEKADAAAKVQLRSLGAALWETTISDIGPPLGVRGPNSLGVSGSEVRCSPGETWDGVELVEEDVEPPVSDESRDSSKRERSSLVNRKNEKLGLDSLSYEGGRVVPVARTF
jgi:hypothetical protein